MPSTTEVTLVLIPMAVYLYALGIFHGGKHPKLVTGAIDLGWLMFGLSGLVAFGPVGHVVVAGVFGREATALAWSVWLASLALAAALIARTGRNRLVVYHVEPDQIRAATRGALGESFATTLRGFEDAASRTSVLLRTYPRMRTAVVEATGERPGAAVILLRPRLREALRSVAEPVSPLSTAFFTASSLVMLGPVVGFLTLDPQGRRAVRIVGRWLGWG